jgi:Mrp family chromosome partitioning ATPase
MGVREVIPWDPDYKLRPYAEGLRDRIITWFERRNLAHKPKLVAITSCNKGAGVTSIAAGLAAALSETGDGKVLLVDLNLEVGAAHPFYEGRPACGIMEALDRSQRRMALAQSNLCVAAGTELNDNQPQTILPRRFTRLIPRLKASDYDYIIFDMLPVDQTSVTARLSGVMDMVLMVLESEKTALPVAKQATALLMEAQANVGFVLNKRRKYVPSWLQHEL